MRCDKSKAIAKAENTDSPHSLLIQFCSHCCYPVPFRSMCILKEEPHSLAFACYIFQEICFFHDTSFINYCTGWEMLSCFISPAFSTSLYPKASQIKAQFYIHFHLTLPHVNGNVVFCVCISSVKEPQRES